MKKQIYTIIILAAFLAGCAGSGNAIKTGQFSVEQSKLILSGGENESMRVLNIYEKSDSILLTTKCDDVIPDTNDAVLTHIIKRMHTTVTDSLIDGVGIAAPQIGISKNIIWVQRYDKPGAPFEVYLNPKIKQYTKRKLSWLEGCLSVPGRRDTTTTRSYAILVEYDRPDKSKNIEMVEGFTSIIFQHEIDHINGIIYIDRIR